MFGLTENRLKNGGKSEGGELLEREEENERFILKRKTMMFDHEKNDIGLNRERRTKHLHANGFGL